MAAYPYIFGAGPNAGGSGGGGSIDVAVSDASPDFGDTIIITPTVTGFTATNIFYYAKQGSNLIEIGENTGANASDPINWTVSLFGTFEIFAEAHDTTASAFNIGGEPVTSLAVIITTNIQLWMDPFLSNIVAPTYPDISGFNRDGTLVNSPTVVAGSLAANDGGYVELNGVNQRIESIGAVADFSFVQNTLVFTITGWVRPTALTNTNTFMATTGASAERGFTLATPNTFNFGGAIGSLTKAIALQVYRGSSGVFYTAYANNAINTVGWHHVAIVGNGLGNTQIYINGVAVPTTVVAGLFTLATGDSTNQLQIGASRTTSIQQISPFTGRIGPWQVYNDAKTAAGVESNFNADKARYGF